MSFCGPINHGSERTGVVQRSEMKNGKCPRCGLKEIFRGAEHGRSGCNTSEFIRVAYMIKVELIHYVCGDCGYTESYIEDPKGLSAIRDKFTRLP